MVTPLTAAVGNGATKSSRKMSVSRCLRTRSKSAGGTVMALILLVISCTMIISAKAWNVGDNIPLSFQIKLNLNPENDDMLHNKDTTTLAFSQQGAYKMLAYLAEGLGGGSDAEAAGEAVGRHNKYAMTELDVSTSSAATMSGDSSSNSWLSLPSDFTPRFGINKIVTLPSFDSTSIPLVPSARTQQELQDQEANIVSSSSSNKKQQQRDTEDDIPRENIAMRLRLDRELDRLTKWLTLRRVAPRHIQIGNAFRRQRRLAAKQAQKQPGQEQRHDGEVGDPAALEEAAKNQDGVASPNIHQAFDNDEDEEEEDEAYLLLSHNPEAIFRTAGQVYLTRIVFDFGYQTGVISRITSFHVYADYSKTRPTTVTIEYQWYEHRRWNPHRAVTALYIVGLICTVIAIWRVLASPLVDVPAVATISWWKGNAAGSTSSGGSTRRPAPPPLRLVVIDTKRD